MYIYISTRLNSLHTRRGAESTQTTQHDRHNTKDSKQKTVTKHGEFLGQDYEFVTVMLIRS